MNQYYQLHRSSPILLRAMDIVLPLVSVGGGVALIMLLVLSLAALFTSRSYDSCIEYGPEWVADFTCDMRRGLALMDGLLGAPCLIPDCLR